MKKSLKYILIERFFNPTSPIMTIVIGWVLTLIATPLSNQLPWFIQFCLNNKNILLIIILVWLGFDVVYNHFQNIIENKHEEFQKILNQNEIYERNANLSANIILNKYGEFADFQRLNIFNDIFRRFVSGNADIECAQIYRFETFYQKKDAIFKINYITGYAQEGVEINGIIQEYYSIGIEISKELDVVIQLWKKLLTQGNNLPYKDLQEQKEEYFVKTISLFDKLVDGLNNITDTKNIREKDFSNYLIVILLLRLMNDTESITLNQSILKNDKIEAYLSESKRNGILGSILLKDNFSILHNGKSLKNGRVYLFEYLNIYQEDYIVTFCISPNGGILEKKAMMYDINRYSIELQNMLISDTK